MQQAQSSPTAGHLFLADEGLSAKVLLRWGRSPSNHLGRLSRRPPGRGRCPVDGASCLGTGGLRLAHGLLLDDLALALIVEAWWDLRLGG